MLKLLLAVLTIAISPLAEAASEADQDMLAGHITSVTATSGSLEVVVLNTDRGGERNCKSKDPIYAGDKIVTGVDQTVVIELMEKSELVIAPNSSFLIEKFESAPAQQSILHLFYGMVRALVRKTYADSETFAVKTNDAVMGVRGTEFVAQVDPKTSETRLHTLKGRVAMSDKLANLKVKSRIVMVGVGQTSFMRAGMSKAAAARAFDVQTFRKAIQRRAPQFEKRLNPVNARPDIGRRNEIKQLRRSVRTNAPEGTRRFQRGKDQDPLSRKERRLERRSERMSRHEELRPPVIGEDGAVGERLAPHMKNVRDSRLGSERRGPRGPRPFGPGNRPMPAPGPIRPPGGTDQPPPPPPPPPPDGDTSFIR